jgi:histidinol-phosphatase
MESFEISERYVLAQRLARQAGELTLKYYRNAGLEVMNKRDGSPVTAADREAELFLRKEIQREFPGDTIVGEEFGITEGSSGFCWALDPIDGTKSFITGVPLFGTMVAVIDDSLPGNRRAVIGAVHLPGLDEGIYAMVGSGTWYYQGSQAARLASVSRTAELSECVVVSSSVEGFPKRGSSLERLANKVRFIRTWGDVYGYLLVATGRADLMIDPEMNLWDAAAVQPIIEEAGGRFTDWKNRQVIDGGDAIGSNGLVHQQVLRIIG